MVWLRHKQSKTDLCEGEGRSRQHHQRDEQAGEGSQQQEQGFGTETEAERKAFYHAGRFPEIQAGETQPQSA